VRPVGAQPAGRDVGADPLLHCDAQRRSRTGGAAAVATRRTRRADRPSVRGAASRPIGCPAQHRCR
jgi:hypothetical protein